ncbi:hypothetical protein FQR65_LT08019 [Abscondita terminalis]|nr:hypothetical protein FQR65_LT08019 [Abscondita terminalis]
MEESWEKIQNAFGTWFRLLLFTFFVWYLRYHWTRRHLYRAAWKRPGPFPLPFIGSALYFVGSTSDILYNMLSLMKLYKSPVPVWISSKLFFVITEAKDFEIVMNSPYALQKGEWYKFIKPLIGEGLFTADVPKWKIRRKSIMPTFNQKILDSFVPVFVEQSNILIERLEKEVGEKEFDIFFYMSRCTLDIFCETAMGTTINAQISDSDYVKWVNRAFEIVYKRMLNIWYHSDFIFNMTSYSKELKYVIERMRNFTENVSHFYSLGENRITEKRWKCFDLCRNIVFEIENFFMADPAKRKTFLELLFELSEDGEKFTIEELRDEVTTFMIAGSDTTASVNSFTFIMLGMHPDIQEKVFQEVMVVVGPDRSIRHDDLNKLTYLDRVIRETMRLFPVGPSLVRDVSRNIQLEECTIPAGSSVVMFIIAMHWNSSVYSDPFKFNPDRFLSDEIAKRHSYSWLPFSGGSRNCVGVRYAFMAMKALIATVVRKYKFSCEHEKVEDIRLKVDLVLKPVNGYRVSLELRN